MYQELTEQEINDKAEKVAKLIIRGSSIKLLNKTIKLARALSFRGKLYSKVHEISEIIVGLSESDKNMIIKEARKLRSKWRRI